MSVARVLLVGAAAASLLFAGSAAAQSVSSRSFWAQFQTSNATAVAGAALNSNTTSVRSFWSHFNTMPQATSSRGSGGSGLSVTYVSQPPPVVTPPVSGGTPVPEPTGALLFAAGCLAVAARTRRRP